MNEKLGRFVEQIMMLDPGGRWPNSGGDITNRLKQCTADFAQALQEPGNYSREQIQQLAKEIEGLLMAEGTVNNWSQDGTDRLIDTLRDLTPKSY